MPTQDPNVRNKNLGSCSGLHRRDGRERGQALHPLQEISPARPAAPWASISPEFIAHVAEGDFEAAYQVIATAPLPCPPSAAVSAPQESQCEGKCTRGIKNEPGGPSAAWSALWPTGTARNVHTAPHRTRMERPQGCRHRRWPCRPDRRRRPGQAGLQGDRLRGPARGRRRADVRHPRVPSAQGHRPAGDRRPEEDGRGF